MLEMEFVLTIHIVYISGKRMIAQGTDGCLCGSLMEGVMAGEDMLTFVDLALPATEHHPLDKLAPSVDESPRAVPSHTRGVV